MPEAQAPSLDVSPILPVFKYTDTATAISRAGTTAVLLHYEELVALEGSESNTDASDTTASNTPSTGGVTGWRLWFKAVTDYGDPPFNTQGV